MTMLKKRGDKTRYSFSDEKCLGRDCFAAGFFQHRSPTISGSRNTGSPDTPCCLNRAYRGCPHGPVGERTEACFVCDGSGVAENVGCSACCATGVIRVLGLPEVKPELLKKRKSEGWKVAL